MKSFIISKSGTLSEIAKQTLYSLQVATVGLFIPFLFLFGISYKTPKPIKPGVEINISKPESVSANRITVNFNKVLSDKNS